MSKIGYVCNLIRAVPNYDRARMVETIMDDLAINRANAHVYLFNAHKKIDQNPDFDPLEYLMSEKSVEEHEAERRARKLGRPRLVHSEETNSDGQQSLVKEKVTPKINKRPYGRSSAERVRIAAAKKRESMSRVSRY